jgi:hypothetical protein
MMGIEIAIAETTLHPGIDFTFLNTIAKFPGLYLNQEPPNAKTKSYPVDTDVK